MVKRVVGIEGDLVRLRRNARVLDRLERDGLGGGEFAGGAGAVVVVPKGHLWVEGDEGFHSRDSNDYGPVDTYPLFTSLLGRGANPCIGGIDTERPGHGAGQVYRMATESGWEGG